MHLGLLRSELGQDASKTQRILAECGPEPVVTGSSRIALVENQVADLENRRQASGEFNPARDFEGDLFFAEGPVGSDHGPIAATRASCARSSARPTSRTIRVRAAMSRGDSILQTASIARCAWVTGTATDHIIFNPPVQGREIALHPASACYHYYVLQ